MRRFEYVVSVIVNLFSTCAKILLNIIPLTKHGDRFPNVSVIKLIRQSAMFSSKRVIYASVACIDVPMATDRALASCVNIICLRKSFVACSSPFATSDICLLVSVIRLFIDASPPTMFVSIGYTFVYRCQSSDDVC